MIKTRQDNFPDNWLRPLRCTQRTLFPKPVEEFLALASVSADELNRWRQLGWISFDVGAIEQFDDPEWLEVCFIRNLARSGLSDSQINQLLEELPKPYAYDPTRTAYSFAYGWVQIAPDKKEPAAFDVIEEHLDAWMEALAEAGDLDRLRDLMSQAFDLLSARERAKEGSPKKSPEA